MRSILRPNPERMRLKGDLNGLIRLVHNKKDPVLRKEAISAVGRMQTPDAVPDLMALFTDSDSQIRTAASDALVHIGRDAVGPLIASYSTADEQTARMVNLTLTGMGVDVARGIIKSIPDLQGIGLERAAYTLNSMGHGVIPLLIDALDTSDQTTIRFIEGVLETFGRAALQPLMRALSCDVDEVRARAAAILIILGDTIVPELLASCAQDEESVRELKFYIISEIGKPALEPLYQALKDPNPVTSSMAQKAFLEFGESAIMPLISGLYDPDSAVRQVSENALIRIGEPVIPHLIAEIPYHKENEREPLVSVLIRIGEPGIGHLIRSLNSPQAEISGTMVQVITRIGVVSIPYLLNEVGSQANTKPIEQVFRQMGRIGYPFLEEAAEREQGKVALFAIQMLKVIDPVRSVEPLTGALYHPEKEVRESALENLVEIGEMAIPRLVQVLGSGNEEAVDLAKIALIRNGEAAVPHLVDSLGDSMSGEHSIARDILSQAGLDALPYLIPAMASGKPGHEDAFSLVQEAPVQKIRYLIDALQGASLDLSQPIIELLHQSFDQNPGLFIREMFQSEHPDNDILYDIVSRSPGVVIPDLIQIIQGDDPDAALAAGDLLTRFGLASIDPLIDALAREEDDDRRLVITTFLIKTGPEAIPSLIKTLERNDLAPYAVAALGSIGEPAVPALLPLLKSTNMETLNYAVLALTRVGEPAASHLMALMQENESMVPLISRILAEMGGAALPDLIDELQSLKNQGQEGTSRGIAVMSMITEIAISNKHDMQTLFQIRDPTLMAMLERLFISKGETILAPVIEAVIVESSVPDLAASIFSSMPQETLSLTSALMKELPSGDTRRIPLLHILGLLKNPKAMPLIFEALKDGDYGVRLAAVQELGKFGREALEPLTEAMHDRNPEVRAAAVESLGYIGLPVLDQLITALKDEDGSIRAAAIQGIARIGEPGQFMLVQSLDDPDRQVRIAVSRLLDESGWEPKYTTDRISYLFAREKFDELVKIGPPSVDILVKGVRDADHEIQERSKEALGIIRNSLPK